MDNNYLSAVREFHQTFKAPILETPQIPLQERCELRINLMQEELDEIKVAISDGDIVGISDGLADLMYVLCGSILEFGLEKKFNQIFNEVQRSNMSKACCSEKEAIETLLHYKEKDGTEGYYERIADKWIVYRSGDNKVLKSINYSKADLDRILKSK